MDPFAWFQDALGNLTAGSAPFFVARAGVWLRCLAGIILTIKFFQWMRQGGMADGLIHFAFQLGAATVMLHYWATPLPYAGVSMGQLIPHEMTKLSSTINVAAFNEAQGAFKNAYDALQANAPAFDLGFSLSDALVWGFAIADMWLSQALMFAINIVSYLAVGLGIFLGPLFIPWMMWPKWSFLTTSLFVYLIEFSLWRLVATALTYVFAKAWTTFFTQAMHGNYTLVQFGGLMTVLLILAIAQIWSFFAISRYVTDLVKGGATAGSNMIGGIALAARALV